MENAEAVLSLATPIHRIIIDIFMQGMGGIEGIERTRAKWRPESKRLRLEYEIR